MKDFLVNLIKLILSVLVIMFTEEYFYKLLDLLKLSINSKALVSLIVYVVLPLLCFIYIALENNKTKA